MIIEPSFFSCFSDFFSSMQWQKCWVLILQVNCVLQTNIEQIVKVTRSWFLELLKTSWEMLKSLFLLDYRQKNKQKESSELLNRKPEMDQVPWSRNRNDSKITEIYQIRNKLEIIGRTCVGTYLSSTYWYLYFSSILSNITLEAGMSISIQKV